MTHRKIVLSVFIGAVVALSPLAASGKSEGSIQKSWDYPEGIKTLVIDAERQDVILKAGGPRLVGRVVGDGNDAVKTTRDGETLTITVRTERNWFSWSKKTSRVEVTLPAGLAVEVTTASGAVLVQVPTSALRVRTASGDIEARHGGKDADVDSASGTVRLTGFSGLTKANSLSGDLRLDDLTGTIEATTLSGDLEASGLVPGAKSRFSTVSGDAHLSLKGGASAYSIRTETVSGDTSVDPPDGKGPEIIVKTVSGDIRIR